MAKCQIVYRIYACILSSFYTSTHNPFTCTCVFHSWHNVTKTISFHSTYFNAYKHICTESNDISTATTTSFTDRSARRQLNDIWLVVLNNNFALKFTKLLLIWASFFFAWLKNAIIMNNFWNIVISNYLNGKIELQFQSNQHTE